MTTSASNTLTEPTLDPAQASNALCYVIGTLSAVILHALAAVSARAAHRLELPRTLARAREENAVALTFDDGPHPEGTPAILDVLAARDAVATFFVIGEQVQRRPELVREIAARGHAVALHGHRHRLQSRLRAPVLADDIARGLAAIEDAIGVRPTLHRPPYGIYSPSGLEIVRGLGLQPLLWARWGKDWRRFTTPARIAARATRGVRPGDVILLHDADFYSARRSHERTAAALPAIIENLKARGTGTVLAV
jgi:peptidoglycan/xylan/chitin deacetylase (PgdA/CDA1 family)